MWVWRCARSCSGEGQCFPQYMQYSTVREPPAVAAMEEEEGAEEVAMEGAVELTGGGGGTAAAAAAAAAATTAAADLACPLAPTWPRYELRRPE